MKITIMDKMPDEEDEIIIKCDIVDEDMRKLINRFKQGSNKLNVYRNGEIFFVEPEEIFYFESVDEKVFAYGKTEVYEVKSRLYELVEQLPRRSFFRASKSSILNLDKIQSLTPAFSGRYEALLKNGEKVIISRQYANLLKEKLGV